MFKSIKELREDFDNLRNYVVGRNRYFGEYECMYDDLIKLRRTVEVLEDRIADLEILLDKKSEVDYEKQYPAGTMEYPSIACKKKSSITVGDLEITVTIPGEEVIEYDRVIKNKSIETGGPASKVFGVNKKSCSKKKK